MKIPKPLNNRITIYSKNGCKYCDNVKQLVIKQKVPFTIIKCDEYLLKNKQCFLQNMYLLVGKEYNTFPMVFSDGIFVGGFTDTEQYFQKLAEKQLNFHDFDF